MHMVTREDLFFKSSGIEIRDDMRTVNVGGIESLCWSCCSLVCNGCSHLGDVDDFFLLDLMGSRPRVGL